MKLQDFTGPIDLDITLREASLDPDIRDKIGRAHV